MPGKKNIRKLMKKDMLKELMNVSMNLSYKYPRFKDFWKTVSNRDSVAGLLTMKELEEWSQTVFNQARAKKV